MTVKEASSTVHRFSFVLNYIHIKKTTFHVFGIGYVFLAPIVSMETQYAMGDVIPISLTEFTFPGHFLGIQFRVRQTNQKSSSRFRVCPQAELNACLGASVGDGQVSMLLAELPRL